MANFSLTAIFKIRCFDFVSLDQKSANFSFLVPRTKLPKTVARVLNLKVIVGESNGN